jgi:hypothetical protein
MLGRVAQRDYLRYQGQGERHGYMTHACYSFSSGLHAFDASYPFKRFKKCAFLFSVAAYSA